ncbi:unnamed protein product [Rhizophagus irregularis]|uniref:Uncharacterized protein n=1 Tax=Rhizophagus irregularis TaxID=588596 RepID=A0A2I1GD28_9GLOM|nr:hypothetical protein RhiirA4_514014 [Rhizophagus irregularis]CAB4414152.1 unnamed protein product [Rhizophagus irregularis]
MNKLQQFKSESKQIRENLEKVARKRDELVKEILNYENEIEMYLDQEENLRNEMKAYEDEQMEVMTDEETDEGWRELLIKARIVKAEKNQLIKERKILLRGVVNYVKNMWLKREVSIQEKIERLQEKENDLYGKVYRLSEILFKRDQNPDYIWFKTSEDEDIV